MINVGDSVAKSGGDYRFDGVVVAAFEKISGQKRFVVEDERGLLFIFNETQLTRGCKHEWERIAPDSAFELTLCKLCGVEDVE